MQLAFIILVGSLNYNTFYYVVKYLELMHFGVEKTATFIFLHLDALF